MFPGGKGANQAVAAVRMGGTVSFICSVGDDIFGQNALKGYKKEGLNVDGCMLAAGSPSGVALITVNKEGENEIVVASGANNLLSESHISAHSARITSADIVLTQLETPIEVVKHLAAICKNSGQRFVINPAPAQPLSDEILDGLFLITPNETESKLLTGIDVNDEQSAELACKRFLSKGVQNVIITMGSNGAFFMNATEKMLISPPKVTAVDTTAAGDIFNGTLVVFLAQGLSWQESITLANKAAAISVTKMGAQASAPFKDEIN